jgi:hypothetical protein
MRRPRSLTVIASLAIAEGILATLVGLLWLQLGSIFDQEGEVLSSIIVMVAQVRGWLALVLALMYFVFAAGAWQTRSWAWWVGLLVSVLTILQLVRALLMGAWPVFVLFALIVPVIILWYLLSPMGRQAFGREVG